MKPGGVLVLVAALVAVSCSSADARGEVLTPFGNPLDCIDERIAYTTFDQAHLGAVGWDEPAEALAAYPELDRPPGTPNLEESTYSEAVFLFTSREGDRLGRVGVGLTQRGWFVMWAEKCALVTANEGPSQTPAEARRDGVIPELAELPFALRVGPLVEVPAEEGTWILATPTQTAAAEDCLLGDTASVDPEEVICVTDYGEVLLVDGAGTIVKAYPMPAAKPTWIAVRPDAVYAGRIGDGALPDSTLVRIDRHTLEAEVLAIQSSSEPGLERYWPHTWHVATPEQARLYAELVHLDPQATGLAAASWTGPVVIDPEGIDRLFAGLTPGEADFALDEVVEALTGMGASVQQAGQAPGFPFSVPQQRLTANGYELAVHEYADVAAQEAEAATVLMEGWSVNHTPVEWIGSPHYWIRGRVIVMYVGDEEGAIDLLTGALGTELDVTALPGACSGDDGPSRVEGILWVVGGRYPGLDQPTAGIVWVYPDTADSDAPPIGQPSGVEPVTESAVDSTGEFVIHLPPGTYVLAADMVGGHACEPQVVEVGEGGCTPVTITCHIR